MRMVETSRDTRAILVDDMAVHAMTGNRDITLTTGCECSGTKPVKRERLLQGVVRRLGCATG